MQAPDVKGFLHGLQVLEIGEELGEYAGKLLAGLGADVVRVEPPTGSKTRSYGPFYRDEPERDRSLFFWHFNQGKRSVVVDLDSAEGRSQFLRLASAADVIVDSGEPGSLTDLGVGYEQLAAVNPALIYARISPFGDDGPWSAFKGSDMVHLALAGVVMNCGYDPDPAGNHDTPPVAPQMWQAYQIAGEMAVMGILGALLYRCDTGRGQRLDTSVHAAVSMNTETDIPDWIFLRRPHHRLTCRHSTASASGPGLSITKDGRYVLPYRTYLRKNRNLWDPTVRLLDKFGIEHDLADKASGDYRYSAEGIARIDALTDQLVGGYLFGKDIWLDAQEQGLPWAPIRRPEESVAEAHWRMRGAFVDIEHPELGISPTYVGARWYCEEVPWANQTRAPLLGEHSKAVVSEWVGPGPERPGSDLSTLGSTARKTSRHGKPFALAGVRVVDLSWMLASSGAGRYLSALGAEVVKVEHSTRLDGMRSSSLGECPVGGRPERERADAPISPPGNPIPDRSGSFMEINAGKLSVAIDLKNDEGRKILEDLIRGADIVLEGFSPGTMKRLGLGYEQLREWNPDIIYVQQSGFGEFGTYGRMRAFGPTVQALTGLSDMSGLPEPYPPAGIGYSYLDWFGAYNMAVASLAALYRRARTGRGCHIDASQAEVGFYLTGTALLDSSANGRRWSRYGNRSPYKQAELHGIFPTRGVDRWIAIAAFTEFEWEAVVRVLDLDRAAIDADYATSADRRERADGLELLVSGRTVDWDGFDLMHALQSAGVSAGVCQSAEDRIDDDPQLRHLGWLVELDQQEIGRWPVREHPTAFSETPPYMGGPFDRSGPNYGADTDYVLAEILGMDAARIGELRARGAVE